MGLFSLLFFKLIPLYISILLGFIAGRVVGASRDTIARMIFYIISPLVIFNGVLHTQLSTEILTLPFTTFLVSSLNALLFYRLSRPFWQDSTRNILAFTAGNGNTGFFGLPVAFILFDEQTAGIYIMCFLGVTLFENTLGFYLSAKGTLSGKELLHKLYRLPALYAFLLGLAINLSGFSLPNNLLDFMKDIQSTYTILGMMIIGLGLASLSHFRIDFAFLSLAFLAKFFVWPLLIFGLIWLDTSFLLLYTHEMHRALILISIVPLAVNTIVISSLLKLQPDKAATAVLFSILFALFYVPFMATLYLR